MGELISLAPFVSAPVIRWHAAESSQLVDAARISAIYVTAKFRFAFNTIF